MSDDTTMVPQHAAAWHDTQRSWQGLITVYVVLTGVALFALIPEVAALLGLSLLEVAIGNGIVAAIATLGVIMFYRLGGTSPLYEAYDVVETFAVQLVLNGYIYLSDQPVSPVWAFWMLHTCLTGPAIVPAKLQWTVPPAVLGLPLVQGILHLVAGDVPGAALCFVMTLAGGMGYTYGRSFAKRLRNLAADRVRLQDELGQMRMAEDRRRIARDLHDGLGAELAAIAWRSAALAQRPGSEALANDLRALTARATSGIDEIRSVVWAADAQERSWHEVVAYLRGRAAELAPAERMHIHAEGDDIVLPGAFTAHYVRFVLEAMRNAVAHGAATDAGAAAAPVIEVRLVGGPAMEAHVENASLDARPLEAAVGAGLENLRTRARLLGGTVELGAVDRAPAESRAPGRRFRVSLVAPRPSFSGQ